ncbi:MAG: hypothetical protein RLZZ204_1398, partial [Bacteroidota bacterium]
MKKLNQLFFFLVCICSLSTTHAQQNTIEVEGGKISGLMNNDKTVESFKGIPFAAPPVGDLRWRAPQPVQPWKGVLACTKFSASPMQGKPVPFSMWSEEFL